MDFGGVLRRSVTGLEEEGVPVTLVGGFALAAFGIVRATLDQDLLTCWCLELREAGNATLVG